MNGRPDYPPRPPSEQLVDLHVYLVPAELWRDHLQSAVNQIINDTVSAGFIRVLPETTINAMRSDLENQLDDVLPRDYVFLKSVGRCLARVRPKQEYQLKAKNFLPPQAYSPEIFILEVSPELRATFPPSGASSERSDSRPAPNSSDPYSHYRPIPPIKNGSSSGYPYNGDPNSGEDHFPKPYKNSPNPYSITPDNYTRSFATQTGTITPPSLSPFHKVNQSHPNVNPNRYNIHTQTQFPSNELEKSRMSQSGKRSSSVHTQTNFDNHYPNPSANSDHVTYRVASHDQRSAHYPGGKQGAASPRGMNGYSANTASNTVNPSYSQFSAPHTNRHVGRVVDKSPHRGGNHHGRSAHAGETARTPGDSSQTPLSASPPNSPVPGETKPVRSPSAGDYRSQQGEGYLPPLSATPPHTPDTSKYRLTNGADAGLDDLERQRMDEMYRNDERNNTGNMDSNNAGNTDRNNTGNMDRNNTGNMDRNYAGNTERKGAGNITRNITGNDQREYERENQGKSASSSRDLSNQHHLPAYPCSQPPLQHHPAAAPARLGPNHHLSTILESPAPHPAQHQALPPSGVQPWNLSHTSGDTQKVAPPVWPESTHINQGLQAQNSLNIPTQVCNGAQNEAPNANQGGSMNKLGYRRKNSVRKGKSKEIQPVKVASKNHSSDSQADQVLLENPSTTDRESISDDSHDKKNGYAKKFHRKPRSGKRTSKRRNAGSGRRQAEEKSKREWEEEERRRKEEERRRWEEEQRKNEENRRRESEDERLRREAEERRRREEDEARRRQLEAMNRTPADRAREKERLMEELEQARQDRKAMERSREEYVRKAKGLQARTQQKRNQARDLWKKKYFEEKKKTAPLEDQSNKLKQELDSLHKRIMATLEGPKDSPKRASDKPSSQSNYKIQATRLQHDIEDLQRRVDNVKMKLTAEMKLRNQAESELRALRAEVTQKKINLTLTRSQLGPISQQRDQTVNNPAPSPMVTQR